ncbi:MAG: hypothetical protein MJ137_01670 [Clostridia bacterium]|nr:hypothetical protein [Clostridia bacterium]
MRKRIIKITALLLAASAAVPLLSGCSGIGDYLEGLISDYIAEFTSDITESDTAPISSSVPEPQATFPVYEYTPSPDEVFPDAPSREAARIADPAIAEGYRAVSAYPDDGSVIIADFDASHRRTAYSTLSDSRKKIYDTVYGSVSVFGDYLFNEKDEPQGFITDFLGVYDALRYDHPDIFMYSSFVSKGWTIKPVYFLPSADANSPADNIDDVAFAANVYYRTFDRIIDAIPSDISNYGKCVYLCAVISALCTYDRTLKSGLDIFPPYGALIVGTSVCQGYADSFLLLAQAAGIECDRTWGTVRGESHVWNRVQTSEGELYIDATWTDNLVEDKNSPVLFSSRYFLMTREDLEFYGYENVTNTPDFIRVY